jgi:hypothetical protein
MNEMGGKLKIKINKVTVKSCFHLLSEAVCVFEVHRSMNVENTIEIL